VDEYNELLAEVIDECSSLETLVNQLLLLAETDADRKEVTGDPVQLDTVVSRSAEMFQGVAEHRGLRLRVEPLPPVVVLGNRHYLRQVISNLLDNAIKFTASRYELRSGGPLRSDSDTRGEIVISLEPDYDSKLVRLTIADNGPGISQADLSHIFDRFYRVDRSRTRGTTTGGTGLGLSICQAIILAHQGTITCESELGKGSKFIVTLNLASANLQKEAA
jgi:signal transduction histidine kinase